MQLSSLVTENISMAELVCNSRFFKCKIFSHYSYIKRMFPHPFERISNHSIKQYLCNQTYIYTTKGFATDQDDCSKQSFVTEMHIK